MLAAVEAKAVVEALLLDENRKKDGDRLTKKQVGKPANSDDSNTTPSETKATTRRERTQVPDKKEIKKRETGRGGEARGRPKKKGEDNL